MSKRPFDSGVGVGGARKQRIDLSDLKPAGAANGGGIAGPGTINPYTNRQYSSRYFDILSKRRGLPVYEFLDELLAKVKKNQVCMWLDVVRGGRGGKGGGLGGRFLSPFSIGPSPPTIRHFERVPSHNVILRYCIFPSPSSLPLPPAPPSFPSSP